MNTKLPNRFYCTYLTALLLALTPLAHGQTAAANVPAAPAAANPNPGSDQTVQLSAFEVTEPADRGYTASESMTGARFATPIKDLPFEVNVITSEFLKDFSVFEIDDTVAYVSSLTNLSAGGQYNLRGFNQIFQLRDGFFRLRIGGTFDVDRIEVIKGPEASVYGQASPGGLVNMISKMPEPTPTAEFSVSEGSYNTDRETLQFTGTVAPHTYVIADFGYYERSYPNQYGELRDKELYLAVRHDIDASSTMLVQYEYSDRVQHSPQEFVPMLVNSAGIYQGYDMSLSRIDQSGPNSPQERSMGFLTGIYEKRFSDIWSLRLGANRYWARRWDYDAATSATTVATSAAGVETLSRSTPYIEEIEEDGGGAQADLLAHYFLANGKIENRTVFTFDLSDYYRRYPTDTIAGTDLTAFNAIKVITVGQPIQYWTQPFDYTESVLNKINKSRTTIVGDSLRDQIGFFGGRLLLYAGTRIDYVRISAYSQPLLATAFQSASAASQFRGIEHFDTPSYGANFKLTPELTLFASRSNGYNTNNQSIGATNASEYIPPEKDWGYDYGIKESAFNNRLNLTVDGYYIFRANVLVTDLTSADTTVELPGGNQLVRGVDSDLTYNVTNDLVVLAGWGHIDSKIASFGEQYEAVGRSPAGITPDNYSLAIKYSLPDFLKGLSFVGGMYYEEKTPTQNPNAGDTYSKTTGLLTSSTDQWYVTVPSYYVVNVGAHYRFRTGKIHQSVGLNVNNLLNRDYIRTTGIIGDSRGFYFNYTIGY